MTAARAFASLALAAWAAGLPGCGADRRAAPEEEPDTEDTDTGCDCADSDDTAAGGLGAAANLCPQDYLVAIATESSSSNGHLAFGVPAKIGANDCLEAHQGCVMLAMATGPWDEANPNDAEALGDDGADTALDPMPEYQGYEPSTADVEAACDVSQLRAELRVPEGKAGFSFDFLFASAEYPEYLDQGYNDTFYAIVEIAGLNGGAPTNIAFDDIDNEIEVDSGFFENALHPCSENGTGWAQSIDGGSGSTGWLRTSWPVAAGETFTLTFSIHDEGDCIFDSLVLIDRFTWLTEPPEGGTVIIE